MIKRLDRIDITTAELDEASRIYQDNFGFTVRSGSNPNEATISIGGAQIRLRSHAGSATVIATKAEGLAALWLEADNVDTVASKFSESGIPYAPIRDDEGRRVLAVDAAAANQVPLFIFDRRG